MTSHSSMAKARLLSALQLGVFRQSFTAALENSLHLPPSTCPDSQPVNSNTTQPRGTLFLHTTTTTLPTTHTRATSAPPQVQRRRHCPLRPWYDDTRPFPPPPETHPQRSTPRLKPFLAERTVRRYSPTCRQASSKCEPGQKFQRSTDSHHSDSDHVSSNVPSAAGSFMVLSLDLSTRTESFFGTRPFNQSCISTSSIVLSSGTLWVD